MILNFNLPALICRCNCYSFSCDPSPLIHSFSILSSFLLSLLLPSSLLPNFSSCFSSILDLSFLPLCQLRGCPNSFCHDPSNCLFSFFIGISFLFKFLLSSHLFRVSSLVWNTWKGVLHMSLRLHLLFQSNRYIPCILPY